MYWLFYSLLAVWNHDENTKSACQYSAYVQLSLRRGVYFTQLRINIMCRTKNMPSPKSRYTPKHRHCRQAFIPWETTVWKHDNTYCGRINGCSVSPKISSKCSHMTLWQDCGQPLGSPKPILLSFSEPFEALVQFLCQLRVLFFQLSLLLQSVLQTP